ncbi:PAS domain-containing protein [Methylomonas sp. EFPC3]|uniref:helix-turn-helix transcriptional regulator n=1 Tax=Methylomonas sp. EFPC3 TaxID=3021710 RepID=UPI002415AE6C|nr:PAS domain-containing protein [Methylomonas sp. EFPC3]WFP52298.1 PAS domain-containing protein [Methylomonas sp. EFPC3]
MPENAICQSAAILNSDFIAIAIVKDRHVVWANAAMHRMFGYEPSELVGLATRQLFLDQASYEAFGHEAYSAIAAGQTYTDTIPQRRKDGTTGWYEINISSLAGYPDMAVGAIVDRTDCYRNVQRLEESELCYRSVVEDQTEAICRFLPDGTFLFVNEVYCRLFGKSAAELIGHRWQPIAHPDDVPRIEAGLGAMSPDQPVIVIENRVFGAGGKLRWMQFVNRGFYDDTGTLKEIQSVGRDITRLKQIESDLRESDERLEMALAASGLVLWDWNIPERKVTAGNRWFDLLGYTDAELGTDEDDWMALINPRDLERFRHKLQAHLHGETASFESEHQLRHKDGHWVTVEAKGKVTRRDKDGMPLRMVGTIQDITMRKRLNEEGMDLLKRIESLIRESSSYTPAPTAEGKTAESLTKRQRQILGLIAIGMTSAEIGKRLHLATPTVISHRRNLMAKLDLHSTAEVTKFAIDHGLLPSK